MADAIAERLLDIADRYNKRRMNEAERVLFKRRRKRFKTAAEAKTERYQLIRASQRRFLQKHPISSVKTRSGHITALI